MTFFAGLPLLVAVAGESRGSRAAPATDSFTRVGSEFQLMVDFENYHGGCCIFQSELLETHPKIKGYFWVRGGIPGIKPSSPPIPHPIVPLISPIPSSLIHSSCHPTTSSLYPSSLKFFTPSSTHPFSAPPLFHYWTSSLHPGLVFWSVQRGGGTPLAEATPSPGLMLPSPFLQPHTSPTNNGGCAADSYR